MTQQLAAWEGDFGIAYTDRNAVDWRVRLPAFQKVLQGLHLQRVLEVGCNRGHNLVADGEASLRKQRKFGTMRCFLVHRGAGGRKNCP